MKHSQEVNGDGYHVNRWTMILPVFAYAYREELNCTDGTICKSMEQVRLTIWRLQLLFGVTRYFEAPWYSGAWWRLRFYSWRAKELRKQQLDFLSIFSVGYAFVR